LHDVLYIGAENGYLFAVDAAGGQELWKAFVGVVNETDGCGGPYGVDGTAVIDRASNRVYVPGGDDRVYALVLATGAVEPGRAATPTPTQPRCCSSRPGAAGFSPSRTTTGTCSSTTGIASPTGPSSPSRWPSWARVGSRTFLPTTPSSTGSSCRTHPTPTTG